MSCEAFGAYHVFIVNHFQLHFLYERCNTNNVYIFVISMNLLFLYQIRQVVLMDELCSCKHGQHTGTKHTQVTRPRHTGWHLYRLLEEREGDIIFVNKSKQTNIDVFIYKVYDRKRHLFLFAPLFLNCCQVKCAVFLLSYRCCCLLKCKIMPKSGASYN